MTKVSIGAQANAVEAAIGALKRREIRGMRPSEAQLLESRLEAAARALWTIERWRLKLPAKFLAEVEG